MSSLVKSALILSFARFTNYAVMLVTPLLLVRVLDLQAYGQYREFLLYATVLVTVLGLAIKDNLIFIVPRHPDKAKLAAAQTANLLLVTTVAGLAIFVLGRRWFMAGASFDFAWSLALYVLFFLSYDILESYWLGRQQPFPVLLYSTLRTFVRMLVVVVVAYVYRDVLAIITSIIVVEILRWLVTVAIIWRLDLLRFRVDRDLLREQLRFILPLSGAGLIYFVNERAGHLFVSAALGVSALAMYTVGTYQLPIIAVVRSAVADTLFPEMVKRAAVGSAEGLELWKTVTLYYLMLVLPAVVVLMFAAEIFIETLFTVAYVEATDVFRLALLVMIRQCFEVGTPLRAVNANRHLLIGNAIAMGIHLPMLYVAVSVMGIAGAALAWVIADLVAAGYMARTILLRYGIGWERFARWREVALIAASAVCAGPMLFLANVLPAHRLVAVVVASLLYGAAYLLILKITRVREVEILIRRFGSMARRPREAA